MLINWAGYAFQHDKAFSIRRRYGSGDYLLLFFKTSTVIELEDEIDIAEPNSIILFDKGYRQWYYTAENILLNDFIHFDFDEEREGTLLHGVLFNRPMQVAEPELIRSLFQFIVNEYSSGSQHRLITMEYLFGALIHKIKDQYLGLNEKIEPLNQLHSEIYSNPHFPWTVPLMAAKCHLSRAHFQTVYKKTFGVSCMNDVIAARCILAKRLLKDSHLKIYEIAESCGYQNPVHFVRQFKKQVGMPPLQYRMNG